MRASFSSWVAWARQVSTAYVYLHPLTVAGAGRDTIACAVLGVPVIGNRHLDAQRILFPDLACSSYEVLEQERLLRRLVEDDGFYDEVRAKALSRIDQFDLPAGIAAGRKVLERIGCQHLIKPLS